MNRLLVLACVFLGACTAQGVIGIWPSTSSPTSRRDGGWSGSGPGCGLDAPAFCETFDAPIGGGGRAGQLDGTIWWVSRNTGDVNTGQGVHNGWMTTQLLACGQTVTVQPDDDVQICDGHLVEAMNDNFTVTTLTMSVRQPFDIAGRTGIVAFDVSDNAQGRVWPELAYADEPVDAMFTLAVDTWGGFPKNGISIALGGACDPDSGCGACPGVTPYRRVGFSGAQVVSNYVPSLIGPAFADSRTTLIDCVAAATGPDQLNHFELHIAQNAIEIYGTDAGTTAPLKKLVSIRDVNLPLTRGYLSLKDVHNHGDAANGQGTNTFAWDNLAFDGPRVPRDLGFSAKDNREQYGDGRVNLGWIVFPEGVSTTSTQDITVSGVSGMDRAGDAWLTFTVQPDTGTATIGYSVNGNAEHVAPWPYTDQGATSWKTIKFPVPLAELVSGVNTIRFSAKDNPYTLANVDLVLTGAGGI